MAKIGKELAVALDEIKNEIKSELKGFRESFERDIRSELREIKSSLTFIDKKYDEMRVDLKAVQDENKHLRTENANLIEMCNTLSTQAKAHESRLVDCEQYSRNVNLEIKGIPVNAGENLLEIMEKLGDSVGEPISASDIDVCHRTPVPGNPTIKNTIVQFVHRHKRDAVLAKSRKKRLSCDQLGFTTSAPIYVNEHLCPERKRLLAQTISKKREVNWKFVWVRGGQIYAKKSENNAVLKISGAADLSKMT